MNTKTEQLGANQLGLIIEIEPADYAPGVDKAIKDFRHKASVPGFRQGMVPIGVVKKMHGAAIKADVVNKIIVDELHKYLTDNKISYLGEPILNHEKSTSDFEVENNNFMFFFEIGLQPVIDWSKTKFNEITEFLVEPTDEQVNNEISYLTRQYGTLSEPTEVADEDLMYGNITRVSTPEVEAFESTIFLQAIENKKIKKEFIGKKAGDSLTLDLKKAFDKKNSDIAKTLKIKEEEVADADTNINFEITRISRITPSEINEELYAKIFPGENFASEADFIAKVKTQLSSQFAESTRQKFMNDAITELVNNVEVDVPHDFMKKWLIQSNKETTAEIVDAEYEKSLDSIKWQLIENKLVQDNGINVSRQDIKDFIMDFFRNNYFKNSTDEDLEERLSTLAESSMKQEKDVKNIYDQLFDKKIEAALRGVLPVTQKSVTSEQFMEMVSKK